MGNATQNYIRQDIEFKDIETNQCTVYLQGDQHTSTPNRCFDYTVTDHLAGEVYRYRYVLYGGTVGNVAMKKYDDLRASYKDELLGDQYDSIVEKFTQEKSLDASQ